MEINEAAKIIVDSAYQIHTEIGPGLFESVYELVLADRLMSRGLMVQRRIPIPIRIGGKTYDEGFRADLIVNQQIIVEIKSIERLAPVHKKQVLTYLKLSGLPIGLLINFGGALLKGNIERPGYRWRPEFPRITPLLFSPLQSFVRKLSLPLIILLIRAILSKTVPSHVCQSLSHSHL
jgi:GxxExxY protein